MSRLGFHNGLFVASFYRDTSYQTLTSLRYIGILDQESSIMVELLLQQVVEAVSSRVDLIDAVWINLICSPRSRIFRDEVPSK